MRIVRAVNQKNGAILEPIGSTGRYRRTGTQTNGPIEGRRVYDAAVMNRHSADWVFSPLSADAEIRQSYRNLRARSRDQERNDTYAEHYYALMEQNVIGATGIGLQMKLTLGTKVDEATGESVPEYDAAANTAIEKAWERQCRRENYTTTRDMSATAADKLILRTMLRDGDLLIRKIPGFPNECGFAIQILEGDLLDETYTDFRAVQCRCPEQFGLPFCQSGTHQVKMGVELHGDWNFPVAYHLLAAHPGDYLNGTSVYSTRRTRVPVDQVIHPYVRRRPGQTRGVPQLAAAMLRLRMLHGYEEAELIAARIAAQKMGFIESDVPDELFHQYFDPKEKIGIINSGAGEVEELPVGKRFREWDPKHPNGNYPGFTKEQLRGVAAGGNVPYTALSGNIEDVNFSSIRTGELEAREGYKGMQTHFIDEVKRPTYEASIESQLLNGKLALPFYRIDEFTDHDAAVWKPRRWPWVDPQADMAATEKAIELNLDTKSNAIAERGGDMEAVFAERAREKRMEGTLGITPQPKAGAPPPAGGEKKSDPAESAETDVRASRSAFLGDITIGELPGDVQETVAKFQPCEGAHSVARYGMTVAELVDKADQHNLDAARQRVAPITRTEARDAVLNTPAKHILLLNDRIVDGHHFLAKAERGKVTSSLSVIDLTPLRFQRAQAPAASNRGLPDQPRDDDGRFSIRGAVSVNSEGEHQAKVESALDAIDRVHAVSPDLPKIEAHADATMKSHEVGAYEPTGIASGRIRLNPNKQGTELTTVEEVGHYLDHHAFGTNGTDLASRAKHPSVAGVMKALQKSKGVQELDRMAKAAKGGFPGPHLRYLAKPEEKFGRAYAQYIATKTQDPVLMLQMKTSRIAPFGKNMYPTDAEFEAVSAEFDKLFAAKGWR